VQGSSISKVRRRSRALPAACRVNLAACVLRCRSPRRRCPGGVKLCRKARLRAGLLSPPELTLACSRRVVAPGHFRTHASPTFAASTRGLIRATRLCEAPQSPASSLFGRPGDPCRYRKGRIELKQTRRRLTRLSIASEMGESGRETAVNSRIEKV
jgi:hypothetical protein